MSHFILAEREEAILHHRDEFLAGLFEAFVGLDEPVNKMAYLPVIGVNVPTEASHWTRSFRPTMPGWRRSGSGGTSGATNRGGACSAGARYP